MRFFKDSADNFYVQLSTRGRTRLVFVVDAPSAYFGRQLPRGYSVADVPRRLRPDIARAVKKEGLSVAAKIGLNRSMPYERLLGGLVAYFRSFEPGEPPPIGDNIYRDLALAKKGVCRHRSFAFTVTAQALGIPARYVFNEAHVFVEAWVPGREAGWLRVDLGGGADRLVVHASAGKIRHQPRARDPFERPSAFAGDAGSDRAAGATRVVGMPPDAKTPDPGPSPKAGSAREAGKIAKILDEHIKRAGSPQPGQVLTRTTLRLKESVIFRGDKVSLRGSVLTTATKPAPVSGAVQLLLTSHDGTPIAQLGVVPLRSDGSFETVLPVPEGQAPGQYQLVAEYLGEGRFAPSASR